MAKTFTYTWVPVSVAGKCTCGHGSLVRYRVEPQRSSLYLNNVIVCDNEKCEEAVIHAGTNRERRGRLILL